MIDECLVNKNVSTLSWSWLATLPTPFWSKFQLSKFFIEKVWRTEQRLSKKVAQFKKLSGKYQKYFLDIPKRLFFRCNQCKSLK